MKESKRGLLFIFLVSVFLLFTLVSDSISGKAFFNSAFEIGKTIFFFSIVKLLLVFGIIFTIFSKSKNK